MSRPGKQLRARHSYSGEARSSEGLPRPRSLPGGERSRRGRLALGSTAVIFSWRKNRSKPLGLSPPFFAANGSSITIMKTAPELLTAYLSNIQDPAAIAALFADDGVIELPWVEARAQGPAAIKKFIAGLLAQVPDFRFKN